MSENERLNEMNSPNMERVGVDLQSSRYIILLGKTGNDQKVTEMRKSMDINHQNPCMLVELIIIVTRI